MIDLILDKYFLYTTIVLSVIGIFFLIKFIIRKFFPENESPNKTSLIFTIVFTPILYIGFVYIMIFAIFYEPSYEFTRERWHGSEVKRTQISKDLIESKLLIGKTKIEVENLLGQPDESKFENSSWFYYMDGGACGFGPDIAYIKIDFKEGKVLTVRQDCI